jgi:hypothetical protein
VRHIKSNAAGFQAETVLTGTFIKITVHCMTASFGAITDYMLASKASRAEEREIARKELEKMSETMVAEKGLLNHVQAATVLGVSVKRISELVRIRKLSRFDFMGRTYVSASEVMTRYQEEIAAGERSRLSLSQKVLTVAKVALAMDKGQWDENKKTYHETMAKSKQRDREKRREFVKKLCEVKAPRTKGKK